MEKELLELYLDGMELDLLSSHLNLGKREIVRKLSELFFNIEHPGLFMVIFPLIFLGDTSIPFAFPSGLVSR